MKKIFSTINILFFLLISINNIYAEDLRDFKVGTNIDIVPERGYVNIRCEDKKEITKWIDFKECKKILLITFIF
jgi:hypothetical protein